MHFRPEATSRLIGAALALASVAATAGQEPRPPSATFSAAVARVVIHATVTGRDGRPVTGLKQEHFTVRDEGRVSRILEFQEADAPMAAGIIVDNSSSMRLRRDSVVAAARAFVETSHPDDSMFVLHFSNQLRYGLEGERFSGDRGRLFAALDRLVPSGQTALYDALWAGLERLREAPLAKKALLIISDGGDNASVRNDKDIVTAAREMGALVYSIGLFDGLDRDSKPKILERLAESTGGALVSPRDPDDVRRACERIARELREQYMLAVAPSDRKPGEFHELRIEVRDQQGHKLRARARAGYQAEGR